MPIVGVSGSDAAKFSGRKCFRHEGELRAGDDDRRTPNPHAFRLGLRKDRLARGQRIGDRLFAPNVFPGSDRLAIKMLVLLHIGEIHQQVERRAGEHLADMGIVVLDAELLRLAFCAFGLDVARAHQFGKRTLCQVRQIPVRNAAAADNTDADLFACIGGSSRFGGSQRITCFDTRQRNCRSRRSGLFQKLSTIKFGSHELLQWSFQGAVVRLNAWQLRKL